MIEELKSKRLPSFIKDAGVFNRIKGLNKIFPKIGLPNCEEQLKGKEKRKPKRKVDKTKKVVAIAKRLRKKEKRLSKTKDTYTSIRYSYYTRRYRRHTVSRPKAWIETKTKMLSLLDRLATAMEDNPSSFVDGTRLVIPKKISAAGITVKKGGMRIQFRALNRKVKYHKLPSGIDTPRRIRNRGSLLSLAGKKIVFSSTGKEGAWDIATMSMRGIHSCQSWTGSYRHNLVGTIADPYAGIIYLTSKDRTGYGSKMHYRSVVRLVVDRTDNKPAILLERIYPNGLSVADWQQAKTLFRSFIRNKGCKLPVHFNYAPNCFIPSSATSWNHPSYRDSGIAYESITKGRLNKALKEALAD